MSVKVGIMGYGTIGKRVADAVTLQKDMELVGITGNSYSYRMEIAKNKGYKIFSVKGDDEFKKVCEISSRDCIVPDGTFQNLLDECDVILDCTPKKVPVENKEKYYIPSRKKAIFQGGEKSKVADVSFVAQCNYAKALNKQFIRVVSCNTTGLCRTLNPIKEKYGIDSVHATLVRRAADPWDVESGPINAIVPVLELPSHHGPDVQTVLPKIAIFTTAMSVSTTLMHVHTVTCECKRTPTVEEAVELFNNTTRIRVVYNESQVKSTAEIMELAKDIGAPRGGLPEDCIWEEAIGCVGNKLLWIQAIHQESDVICENIDAIRCMMNTMGAEESILKTNRALGIPD